MKQKNWVITLLLIIIFFAGVFSYLNYKNKKQAEIIDQRQEAIENAVNRPEITLNTKYQYKDGAHRFAGVLEVPTPCHTVDVKLNKVEEFTEINISYSNNDEICAQIIEDRSWSIEFEGPKDENIIAKLNGEVVNLNIFEVPDNESFEEFDFLLKG